MKLEERVKLKELSSFKIGGEARFFTAVEDVNGLRESLEEARRLAVPFFILGGSTNILWSDEGFEGLVIKSKIRHLEKRGGELVVGAGILMSELVQLAVSEGLAGLEWAGGLPGTLGGAIRGNAGAFGGEIKDVIKEVVSLDIDSLKIIRRSREECRFGYRQSVFKLTGREIIVEAVLELKPGDQDSISRAVQEKITYRLNRHPLEHPNVGSIFKNVPISDYPHLDRERFAQVIKQDPVPVIPTAFLIAEAGLKGVSCGGAMISPKHPNFIVNVLGASAKEVRSLIELAKSEVFDKFGIKLEEEILIL